MSHKYETVSYEYEVLPYECESDSYECAIGSYKFAIGSCERHVEALERERERVHAEPRRARGFFLRPSRLRVTAAPGSVHFPIQNFEKISPKTLSVVIAPVKSASAVAAR
jgi:hypothetical protein